MLSAWQTSLARLLALRGASLSGGSNAKSDSDRGAHRERFAATRRSADGTGTCIGATKVYGAHFGCPSAPTPAGLSVGPPAANTARGAPKTLIAIFDDATYNAAMATASKRQRLVNRHL